MRLWHVLTGLGALALVGALVNLGGGSDRLPIVVSAAGAGVVLLGAGLLIRHAGSDERRMDEAGPVDLIPASRSGGESRALRIARCLAELVEPAYGVVFADARTQQIRIMIDPRWTTTHTSRRRRPGTNATYDTFTPRRRTWFRVDLDGAQPRVRTFHTVGGTATDGRGRIVPVWDSSSSDTDVDARGGPSGSRRWIDGPDPELPDGTTVIDVDARLQQLWSAGDDLPAVAPARSEDVRYGAAPWKPHGVVAVTLGGTTVLTHYLADGETLPERTESTPALPDLDRFRADLERAHTPTGRSGGPDRVYLGVHLGIGALLVLCVLATIIGLIAGMVWWASFIVIGSGLLFAAVWLVPFWLMAGVPWRHGRRRRA